MGWLLHPSVMREHRKCRRARASCRGLVPSPLCILWSSARRRVACRGALFMCAALIIAHGLAPAMLGPPQRVRILAPVSRTAPVIKDHWKRMVALASAMVVWSLPTTVSGCPIAWIRIAMPQHCHRACCACSRSWRDHPSAGGSGRGSPALMATAMWHRWLHCRGGCMCLHGTAASCLAVMPGPST